jgi:uncharacterized protein with von Willebrand factor type A (vWA) domain
MRRHRYSRWDGSQAAFTLDAEGALDALSDLLMEGLDAEQALEWMRRGGFELAGREMRVMGLEELLDELRGELEALEQRLDLSRATDELRERLERILDAEEHALRARHKLESERMNSFLARRHAEDARLSDAIARFSDWEFEDAEAGEAFRELLGELERLRALEEFLRRRGERFRGPERAGYEQAQEIRERVEALEKLARDLRSGRLERISPEELERLLGENARLSLVWLRDLEGTLRRAGYLRERDGSLELTPRAIRRIGAQALAAVYGGLRRGRPGEHEQAGRGAAQPRPDETRPLEFGDALDVDVVKTLLGALRRRAREPEASPGAALPIPLAVQDFEVREADHATQTTTVLLLDMSWSMSWAGRFPAAKRVALALDHLIRTRFPRDRFFVVGFSTRARELRVQELPEVCWDMGDPFTNLQEGLLVAERLVAKHPSPSPQVLVITDGQPTAYFVGRELRVEWPMGFGGVSPHAVAETLKTVRRVTRQGLTINTFMLDSSPELVGFVERMTQINRGRAFFTSPTHLGSFLMVDYLSRRRMRSR